MDKPDTLLVLFPISIFPFLTNGIPILSRVAVCPRLPWQPQRAVRQLANEIEAENCWGISEELIFLIKALSLLLSTWNMVRVLG